MVSVCEGVRLRVGSWAENIIPAIAIDVWYWLHLVTGVHVVWRLHPERAYASFFSLGIDIIDLRSHLYCWSMPRVCEGGLRAVSDSCMSSRLSVVLFTLQDIAKLTVVSRSHGRACRDLLRAAMRETGGSWLRVWDEQRAGYAKIGWREPRDRAVRGGAVSCVRRAVCSTANVVVCGCRSAWAARRLS